MQTPKSPGMYIVTLNNYEPISVNAHDPRIAEKAIKVTRANIKIGKAKSLLARSKNYEKTFGPGNVNFYPVAQTDEIEEVERAILAKVDEHRIRGRTGRKNEWLEGISPATALELLLQALKETGVSYRRITQEGELDL
jgi:hypothetical protein